jgi:hypothetical protein
LAEGLSDSGVTFLFRLTGIDRFCVLRAG